MEIEQLLNISDEITDSLGSLMLQLAPGSKVPAKEYLQEIVDLPNVFLFVANLETKIVGTFTLVLFKIPTGLKVSIEDVVVDSTVRGQKIGERMIRFAIDYVNTELGASKIDLTSSHHRVAANALYRKLGFEQRDTNVYRFELK